MAASTMTIEELIMKNLIAIFILLIGFFIGGCAISVLIADFRGDPYMRGTYVLSIPFSLIGLGICWLAWRFYKGNPPKN